MNKFNQFDKIEDVRRVAEGLKSLQHLLEIVDNTADQISLDQLACLIGALAFKLNCDVDQMLAILHSTE
ncbi:hypothetical protein [Avibacterium paragallinarum]|uniref:Uncharacterized protein n=1 Tax=Avibacterium paragallinarum TaxID=728 RepID=A0A377I997_AVIPA|nr:hypothetical protein [Avibacterium paragallinarum]POY46666.1 hypothetical protein C3364_06190 [Avibacterium paragallinarum]RZN75731.1 hypothetical protein EC523_07125 [Avibacterium paragallinarum]RZN76543.1 hypothetical protein EC523_04535 [Avibacterium paragallinarum]STO71887.1 Uncharacterised protein [Avibacterium paragallinarum]STO72607.1 Uncharacterised protein [Avibacterium paragallinarum]